MELPAILGGTPVREDKIYYGRQWITDEDIEAVKNVLEGPYITCGPKVQEAERILELWLGDYPEHTASFLRLLLIALMITPLENPIGIAKDSTGNIKYYSIVSSTLQGLILVFDYIALKLGCAPEMVFVIQILMLTITLFAKFFMVRKDVCISVRAYLGRIFLRVLLVASVATILPLSLLLITVDSVWSFLLICTFAMLSVLITSFYIGLDCHERKSVIAIVKRYLPVTKK